MKLSLTSSFHACGLIGLCVFGLQVCRAQDATEKLQIYVPFPAGSTRFTLATKIANNSNDSITPIAVPGNGGVKGIDEAVTASKSQVTYILADASSISNWEAAKATKFASQFQLVSLIGISPLVLVVSAKSDKKITAKNIASIVGLKVGDPGGGFVGSICGAAIQKATQENKSQLISYSGTGPMVMELSRGSIDVGCVSSSIDLVQLEKIGVTYKTTIQSLSALPVVSDHGLNVQTRDFVALYRLAVGGKVAPAQLQLQLEKAIDSADVRSLIQAQAMEFAR